MDWLKKAFKKVKESFGRKDSGKSEQKCPLKETGLLVAVVRTDNRRIVKEADVAIEGASGSSKKTDTDGLALFKPLDPDTYKINVTLPGHMADSFEKPEQEQETVGLGSCPVHVIKVHPLSTLKVRVLRMEGDKEKFLEGVKIHIKGRDERDGQTPEIKDGWVAFEKIKSGDYEVSITSLGTYAKVYKIPAVSGTRISAGETKEVIFYVKKAALKIKVVDKNDESRFIPKVKVKIDVLAQGSALPEKTTTENGPVVHDPVEPGKYSATISFSKEDEERYRIPDDEQTTKEITIQSGSTYELVFRVIPIVRVYLKLQFKDPEGKDRIFPEKMPLQLVFEGDEHLDPVVGKDGLVYDKEGDDAKPYVEVERRKKWFKLAFKQPKRAFVVCEEKGKKETQEYLQEEDPFKADTDLRKAINQKKRVFQLPYGDFTWDNADWEISGANTFKDHKVDKIDDIKTEVGKKDSPATVSLELHWQFIRFEYFDRYYGHSEHNNKKISILPVPLEGYGENVKSQAPPPVDKLTTFSNWTIGDDDTKLVQCLPWIIRRKNDDKSIGYPGRDSVLRFQTDDAHRFIKSTAKDSREFTKLDDTNADEHHLPCADRLRYYDLPKEWRSTRYFCRLSDKADEQDFFEAMYYCGYDTDYPLIFSLDDMILTDNNLSPVAWRYVDPEVVNNPNDRLALFINTFQGAEWSVPEPPVVAAGAGAPPSAPLPPYSPTHSAHGKPAPAPIPPRPMSLPAKPAGPSLTAWYSPDGLYRHDLKNKAHFYSRTTIKTNYIADYPNWCRLIVTQGNLHDVLDQRTKFNNADSNQPVGIRAAVRWYTPQTKEAGEDVNAPTAAVKHPNQNHPFFAAQQFYMKHYKSKTKRMDQAGERYIGRYDLALLRCCDTVERKDGKFDELAINLQYGKWNMNYPNDPIPQTGGGTVDGKDWSERVTRNVPDRWNGRQDSGAGANYSVEAWFSPKDPADLKLRIRPLMFMQIIPKARAHYRITVDDADDRAWMNGVKGTGQLRTNYYQLTPNPPSQPGRFSSAHESGHMMALPDDYGETSNWASGLKLGFIHLVPGDPYNFDDQAMMKSNQRPRARNFWHMAEWCRIMNAHRYSFKILKGDVRAQDLTDDWDYSVPHHTTDSKSWVYWPTAHQIAGSHSTRGHYDLFLYRFGDDDTNKVVLPNRTGSGDKFDGILVVNVKLRWKSDDFTTAFHINQKLGWIDTCVTSDFNNKWYATGKKTINGEEIEFERCLIEFVPRYLVENHVGNQYWSKGKNNVQYTTFVNQIAGTQPPHFNMTLNKRASLADTTKWAAGVGSTTLGFRLTTDVGPLPKFDTRAIQVQLNQDFPKKFKAMLGLAENADPGTTPALLNHIATGVLTDGEVHGI